MEDENKVMIWMIYLSIFLEGSDIEALFIEYTISNCKASHLESGVHR